MSKYIQIIWLYVAEQISVLFVTVCYQLHLLVVCLMLPKSQIKLQMRMGPTLQSADSMKHSFWEEHALSTSRKIPIIP